MARLCVINTQRNNKITNKTNQKQTDMHCSTDYAVSYDMDIAQNTEYRTDMYLKVQIATFLVQVSSSSL